MTDHLEIPKDLEGLVGVQIFKARRGYAEPATFEIRFAGLAGARLTVGGISDAYVVLRSTLAAQLEGILRGFRDYDATIAAALARERKDFGPRGRPIAVLAGWHETTIRTRTPIGGWDWVDYVTEYGRGVKLRDIIHSRLDQLAVPLAAGLGDMMGDRIATHQFWVAPDRGPVVVFRESVGSLEASQRNRGAPPKELIGGWIDRVISLDTTVAEALDESLRLIAAARGCERGWLRFTLGWAALERLATEFGARFDDSIEVEQRKCESCGADVTSRRPTIRPRLEALIDGLEMAEPDVLKSEFRRINRLRGRSHAGSVPEGDDVIAPEELAARIVRGVYDNPAPLTI